MMRFIGSVLCMMVQLEGASGTDDVTWPVDAPIAIKMLCGECYNQRQAYKRDWHRTPMCMEARSLSVREGKVQSDVSVTTRRKEGHFLVCQESHLTSDINRRRSPGSFVFGMNRDLYFHLGRDPGVKEWKLNFQYPRSVDNTAEAAMVERLHLRDFFDDGTKPRPGSTAQQFMVYVTEDFDRLVESPAFRLIKAEYLDREQSMLRVVYEADTPFPVHGGLPTKSQCEVVFDRKSAWEHVSYKRTYPFGDPEGTLIHVTQTREMDRSGPLPYAKWARTERISTRGGKVIFQSHDENRLRVQFGDPPDRDFSLAAFGLPDLYAAVEPEPAGVPWTIYGVAVGFALLIVCILLSRRKVTA